MGMKTEGYQYWSEENLNLLKGLYPDTATDELVERFGRSVGAIKTKARQLGLRKSKGYLKAIKSRPRKPKET
jgi:hypothetical protein